MVLNLFCGLSGPQTWHHGILRKANIMHNQGNRRIWAWMTGPGSQNQLKASQLNPSSYGTYPVA